MTHLCNKERTIEGFALSQAPPFSLFPPPQLSSGGRRLGAIFHSLDNARKFSARCSWRARIPCAICLPRAVQTVRPRPGCSRAGSGACWSGRGGRKKGCKLPIRDAMAVVDSERRVHGSAGLCVADAAIMPTVVSGHTKRPIPVFSSIISTQPVMCQSTSP